MTTGGSTQISDPQTFASGLSRPTSGSAMLLVMSVTTLLGIIITVVLGVSIAIVGVMFWWAAREDGREQRRIDARVRAQSPDKPDDDPDAAAGGGTGGA